MHQAYPNIQKVLVQYGATMDNIVNETLFVTDTNMLIPFDFRPLVEDKPSEKLR